ncbi:MAG: polyphosphate kinase 2 [Akkermansiaceae bacterium]|nr:polyphosphate kinase 2 [Akkermansiaceae bacterium]NNM28228.1 polyphosphate kinase 2 [Akkermansiaceae bacterium]
MNSKSRDASSDPRERLPRDFTSDPPEDRDDLSKAETLRTLYRDGGYPYDKPLRTGEYERTKALLQAELMKVQDWVKSDGRRIVALFEGRDAAGKGGTIKRFMEHLNPRHARVVALEKPTRREQGQWYFQRYIQHFPTRGEMMFFDRSWYNRTGVERVMGFCNNDEYEEFLEHCPLVEKMLVETGIIFFKYWFSVSRVEQARRFRSRERNPLKQWKLSPIDRAALAMWNEYTEAKEAMFRHTDLPHAPWIVIRSDDKKRARINCLRHFLASLDYPGKDEEIVRTPDPKIVLPAAEFYESGTDH